MVSLTTTPHIPAWKKLGLRLKSADDPPKQDVDTSSTPNVEKKTKKRKPETRESHKSSEDAEGDQKHQDSVQSPKMKRKKSDALAKQSLATKQEQPQKNKSPKKSVSFASDTKTEDAISTHELTLDPEDDPDAAANKRAAKRRKREERSKRPSVPQSTLEIPAISNPTLAYLSTYQHSRSEWKFQKNRETAVLKYALSVDRIPQIYDAALSTYLSNLKGEAGKQRLMEASKEAIVKDDEDEKDENAVKQRSVYDAAVKSYKQGLIGRGGIDFEADSDSVPSDLDPSWHNKLKKRRRAELVFYLSGGKYTQVQPKKQKRKARTAAVVSDSSSESETSSSGSDSESESESESESDSSDTDSSSGEEGSASDSSSS
ncbi:hypothetical protein FQN57_002324 [Myotisia sp. PD_48]|nr:hypothetical protein FQN57_002324 [Myotisia sp. PD_48]